MKTNYFFFLLLFIFSSCCNGDFWSFDQSDLCRDEIFTKTEKINLKFDYTVNTNKKFIIANTVTADKIRKALKVPEGQSFTLKSIDITSGHINYGRHPDNTAVALNVNFAIVGNTFNQLLLLKNDLLLPLIDIPEIPGLSDAVKINEFFDTEGLKGLKDILRDYVVLANNDGISFLLLGEPKLSLLAHFTLNFNMNVTVVYEVCQFVPIGQGERACN
jgi:hypothetical protein